MNFQAWKIVIGACLLLLFEETYTQDIAIVGGGIGGSSAAYFLREKFGTGAQIDVYESDAIGGRLATVSIAGYEYESGGSIIHPANEYMVNFTRLLGLNKKDDSDGDSLGIFDGDRMVFDGSSNWFMMLLKLFYHFGWDMYRIQSYVKHMLSDFHKIYDHQNEGYSFTTVDSLLRSMRPGFADLMQRSFDDEMRREGFSDVFIDQLVRGAMRTNYGQNEDITGFVGAVSMAGVEPGLWSVYGGNKRVPEDLLKHAQVKVINAEVRKIALSGDNKFQVSSTSDSHHSNVTYDIVVIAFPLSAKQRDIFSGFPREIVTFDNAYKQRYAYFFEGTPSAEYFNVFNEHDVPTEILTCNKNLKISSMGKQLPVTYTQTDADIETYPNVYKIFTDEKLSDEEISEIFPDYKEMRIVDWPGAYPVYRLSDTVPSFELFSNMYYVNAIELAASAMEMSAIGARNVALLALARWRNDVTKVDQSNKLNSNSRDEL